MKPRFIHFFLFSLFIIFPLINTFAQGLPGGGDGPPGGCFPDPCVPIDGGISLLIAAGVAYGGKKLYQAKKNKEE